MPRAGIPLEEGLRREVEAAVAEFKTQSGYSIRRRIKTMLVHTVCK